MVDKDRIMKAMWCKSMAEDYVEQEDYATAVDYYMFAASHLMSEANACLVKMAFHARHAIEKKGGA